MLALIHRARRRRARKGQYERAFRQAIRDAVRPGDCVWDIGANVGFYTQLFDEWTGPEGRVAFQPAPSADAVLRSRVEERPNVLLSASRLEVAEARWPCICPRTRHDAQLVGDSGYHGATVDVSVDTGDSIRRRHRLDARYVVKIDVEGYEEEALRGLSETLDDHKRRAVLCEVHFGVLVARGHKHAPREIERGLRNHGFHTSWIDSSHLGADR